MKASEQDISDFMIRLRAVIKSKKITQKKLSELTNIDQRTISRWRNVHNPPSDGSIFKICAFTGCSFEWLSEGKGEMFGKVEMARIGLRAIDDGNEDKSNLIAKAMQITKLTSNQDVTEDIDMATFKAKCAINFEHVFEFIADKYGQDSLGIQDFLDDLREVHHSYRSWRIDKKQDRQSGQTDNSKTVTENETKQTK